MRVCMCGECVRARTCASQLPVRMFLLCFAVPLLLEIGWKSRLGERHAVVVRDGERQRRASCGAALRCNMPRCVATRCAALQHDAPRASQRCAAPAGTRRHLHCEEVVVEPHKRRDVVELRHVRHEQVVRTPGNATRRVQLACHVAMYTWQPV